MPLAPANNHLIAPCGVYCAACSAFLRGACLGCRATSTRQKRISKWTCRVRNCALHIKNVDHCGQCSEWVCKTYHQKLLRGFSHDKRYNYRFEALNNLESLQQGPEKKVIKNLDKKYSCPKCGGSITFFEYTCFHCGYQPQINDAPE